MLDAYLSALADRGGYLPAILALLFALIWALRALVKAPANSISSACRSMLAEAFATENAVNREELEAYGFAFYEARDAGCVAFIGNSWCAVTAKGKRLSRTERSH